jgi:hypothetical protein
MRTVICHFFNEAYLLPWWLKHHVPLFDYGVMIDHGSSDGSADLVRQFAPHWRLVHTRLTKFSAYLNDLEVMNFEQEIPGWKIALNVTEFIISAAPLVQIENYFTQKGMDGFSCSGFIAVDLEPNRPPNYDEPLLLQKPWAIDDNKIRLSQERLEAGLTSVPERNRFYHKDQVGMYFPGRHLSHHPASRRRNANVIIVHFRYSPWNSEFLARKLQILGKVDAKDLARGWGVQHLKDKSELDAEYERVKPLAEDLRKHELASRSDVFRVN